MDFFVIAIAKIFCDVTMLLTGDVCRDLGSRSVQANHQSQQGGLLSGHDRCVHGMGRRKRGEGR